MLPVRVAITRCVHKDPYRVTADNDSRLVVIDDAYHDLCRNPVELSARATIVSTACISAQRIKVEHALVDEVLGSSDRDDLRQKPSIRRKHERRGREDQVGARKGTAKSDSYHTAWPLHRKQTLFETRVKTNQKMYKRNERTFERERLNAVVPPSERLNAAPPSSTVTTNAAPT